MWNEYHVFITAAKTLSFTRAAAELGVRTSSVSRSVGRLEKHLSLRLFERSSRGMYLTDAGERLRAEIAPHLDGVLAAEHALLLANGRASGVVRVAGPHEIVSAYVSPVITRMLTEGLDVRFEVEATGRLPDPIADHVDVFISHRRDEVSDGSLVSSLLGAVEMGLYAAPSLVSHSGVPKHPEEMAGLSCLSRLGETTWTFTRDGESFAVTPHGPVSATPSLLRIELALAGRGFVIAGASLCRRYVEEGRLVRCLEDYTIPPTEIWAFVPSRRLSPQASKVFLAYLGKEMRRRP